jgi:hypothetical protein
MSDEKKYRRPIYDIITKVNVNKPDAELLLKWSMEASANEQAPISSREIINRLIQQWSSKNVGKYPPRINGTGE